MINDTEEYVSVEVAQLLKTKGFDWACDSYYEWFESGVTLFKGFMHEYSDSRKNHNRGNSLNMFSRPTIAFAMQWLRVVHNLFVKVDYTTHQIHKDMNYYGTVVNMEDARETVLAFEEALTYEGCANRLLKDALENIDKYKETIDI